MTALRAQGRRKLGRGGGRGGSLAGRGGNEEGARARDLEGRGSRDGQPPPLQAGGKDDVTTLPAGGGTSVFFPPPKPLGLVVVGSSPKSSGGLAPPRGRRGGWGSKAGSVPSTPHCACSGRGRCRVPAPCGSQLQRDWEGSLRSKPSLATSWIPSLNFEDRGTRVSLALWAPGG